MTTQSAYQFLKPSLEQLSDKEKKALCELILPEPVKEEKRKPSKDSHIMTIEEMKAALRKTGHFKKQKSRP